MEFVPFVPLIVVVLLLLLLVGIALGYIREVRSTFMTVIFVGVLLLAMAYVHDFWTFRLALQQQSVYRHEVRVENAGGIANYAQGHRCLVDWRGTFAAVGKLHEEPIMRYTRYRGVLAECPTGTLVQMTEDVLTQHRLAIVAHEAREKERQEMTDMVVPK